MNVAYWTPRVWFSALGVTLLWPLSAMLTATSLQRDVMLHQLTYWLFHIPFLPAIAAYGFVIACQLFKWSEGRARLSIIQGLIVALVLVSFGVFAQWATRDRLAVYMVAAPQGDVAVKAFTSVQEHWNAVRKNPGFNSLNNAEGIKIGDRHQILVTKLDRLTDVSVASNWMPYVNDIETFAVAFIVSVSGFILPIIPAMRRESFFFMQPQRLAAIRNQTKFIIALTLPWILMRLYADWHERHALDLSDGNSFHLLSVIVIIIVLVLICCVYYQVISGQKVIDGIVAGEVPLIVALCMPGTIQENVFFGIQSVLGLEYRYFLAAMLLLPAIYASWKVCQYAVDSCYPRESASKEGSTHGNLAVTVR